MNKKPIEQAKDKDLRLSRSALIRAAIEARELAEKTGTDCFDHASKEVTKDFSPAGAIQEDAADYRDKT
jgi:hypothetical protein